MSDIQLTEYELIKRQYHCLSEMYDIISIKLTRLEDVLNLLLTMEKEQDQFED